MNYSIEPDGTIVFKKSYREAEILLKAVQSKNIQLRKDPASKETCDQLLGMSVSLKNAIMDSNKARIKHLNETLKSRVKQSGIPFAPPEARTILPSSSIAPAKPAGLWHRIINFFDNPFYTHEFEWAHTRCGAKFTIDGMVFEKELYPREVYGTVETDDGELQVTWNDRGRCNCKSVKDVHCYDLIRHNQKERDSSLFVGIAFILMLFTVVFFLLNL